MLTRPADLSDLEVVEAVLAGWALESIGVEYSAVGFGSHHWRATDAGGRRWFVSVDDLLARRHSADESLGDVHQRLRAALITARAVHDGGAAFVVAPVTTTDGDVLRRISSEYAAAVYPFVDGRQREFGDILTAAEHHQVLRLIGALHTSRVDLWEVAQIDDFVLPQREELARALGGLREQWDTGPFGQRARAWFASRASRIERLLEERDGLADQARQRPERMVLTHGEPHPGNLIETATGWMLVDWDTALIAPPERDLWRLRGTEPDTLNAYTNAVGHDVMPAMLELYRLTWELGDVASFAARFHRDHDDTADAQHEWATMEHRSL